MHAYVEAMCPVMRDVIENGLAVPTQATAQQEAQVAEAAATVCMS